MKKTLKIIVKPKIIDEAIKNILIKRRLLFKIYFTNYMKFSVDELCFQEKNNLYLTLNKSKKMIDLTAKRLNNLSKFYEKIASA